MKSGFIPGKVVLSLKKGGSRNQKGEIADSFWSNRRTGSGGSRNQNGCGSGFEKELIAAPERVDRISILVGSWNHVWGIQREKFMYILGFGDRGAILSGS